jgi:hypothetical protein
MTAKMKREADVHNSKATERQAAPQVTEHHRNNNMVAHHNSSTELLLLNNTELLLSSSSMDSDLLSKVGTHRSKVAIPRREVLEGMVHPLHPGTRRIMSETPLHNEQGFEA